MLVVLVPHISMRYCSSISQGRGVDSGCPLAIRLGGLESVVSSPSGVRRKTKLVHSDACRRPLVVKIQEIL